MTITQAAHRRKRIASALAAATVTIGVLASCGTGATSGSAAAQYGPPITPIAATSITGAPVTIPPAGRASLLIFYSVGCGTCVGITQHIASIAPANQAADYYAINMDPTEDVRTSKGFLDYIDSPHIVGVNDTSGELTRAYGVNSVSTIVVTDPSGQIILRAISPLPAEIATAIRDATG